MSGQSSRNTLVRASRPESIGIFLAETGCSLSLTRIIRERDGLRDAAAQNLRRIEAVLAVVVGRDEDREWPRRFRA